jgi:hypothetical protein
MWKDSCSLYRRASIHRGGLGGILQRRSHRVRARRAAGFVGASAAAAGQSGPAVGHPPCAGLAFKQKRDEIVNRSCL